MWYCGSCVISEVGSGVSYNIGFNVVIKWKITNILKTNVAIESI
jgi:hypothetical protein